MVQQLTKQSIDQEIKAYFEEVLRLSKDSEEFPVNLDEVWPLVYLRKDKAVRALKNDRLFVENIDYQVLRRNAENLDSFTQRCVKPQAGRPTNIYMLSVPCLEFFIARKVRPVFEVCRQVFHKVASGELPFVCPTAYQATPRERWHRWHSSMPTSWRDTPSCERKQRTGGYYEVDGGMREVLHILPPEGS